MTVDTFKDLCLRLRDNAGKMIRSYFITIESAYKTWANETIRDRRKVEDPEINKEKETVVKNYDVPYGDAWYVDKFTQVNPMTKEVLNAVKFGSTRQIPIRMS